LKFVVFTFVRHFTEIQTVVGIGSPLWLGLPLELGTWITVGVGTGCRRSKVVASYHSWMVLKIRGLNTRHTILSDYRSTATALTTVRTREMED
jgi:hypothetical protein